MIRINKKEARKYIRDFESYYPKERKFEIEEHLKSHIDDEYIISSFRERWSCSEAMYLFYKGYLKGLTHQKTLVSKKKPTCKQAT